MLDIYKASAGSGKTTLLTNEYIKTLLDDEREEAYRNILAVTFTNKATEEMKSRIVEKLHDAAKGGSVPGLSGTPGFTAEKARILLQNILHDYSRFSISTIDKFFQKVIRAFVHEMGLKSNYNLQLDTNVFLEESMDDLLRSLSDSGYGDVLKWLIDSAMEQLDTNPDKWKLSAVQDNLRNFGNEIFKETFLENSEVLNDTVKINECKQSIFKEKRRIEKLLKDKAGFLYGLLEEVPENLRNYFSHYDEIRASLQKINAGTKTDTPFKCAYINTIAEDKFVKKSAGGKKGQPDRDELQAWGNEKCLANMASDYRDSYEKEIITYNTLSYAYKYINSLQIITRLDKFVKERARNNDTLLLSSSNELVSGIIDGSDTPFIYEKTGTRIFHYFLDEFQDTSALQWRNFRPLMAESLAAGNYNMVVGDVKQSIYRFRNSDWQILGKQLERDFPACNVRNLDSNYRSGKAIVEFNNDFFAFAAALLQQSYDKELEDHDLLHKTEYPMPEDVINKAYADVVQQIPDNNKPVRSMVHFDFAVSDGNGTEAAGIGKKCFEMSINKIKELKQAGFSYSSMGILFRNTKEAMAFSAELLQSGIPVISDEALSVSSSKAVRILLALLRFISNPDDTVNIRFLNLHCPGYGLKSEKIANASALPLFQMVQEFVNEFSLREIDGGDAYLQAFSDIVMEYVSRKGGNIDGFLEWWYKYAEEKRSITMPSGADAVNVMTIHKAKGLAFQAVLMPYCDWDFVKSASGSRTDIIWARSSAPFDQIPYLPVSFSSKLAGTLFAMDYYTEYVYRLMDNLNLLYVAFTRPRVFFYAAIPVVMRSKNGKSPTKAGKPVDSIAGLLWRYCHPQNVEDTDYEDNTGVYSWSAGEMPVPGPAKDSPRENLREDKIKYSSFGTFKTKAQKSYGLMLEKGSRLHYVMSFINKSSDLQIVLRRLVLQGLISEENAAEAEEELGPYINNPSVSPWFDGSMQSINERDIITVGDKGNFRPDRILYSKGKTVIVDYKFGEEHDIHRKQVANYAALLSSAGFPDVSAYIYYHECLKIVKVCGAD